MPADALSLLSAVLQTQGDDEAALDRLQAAIHEQPSNLIVLLQTVVPIFQTLKPQLRTWTLDNVLEHALSRAPLQLEQKTTLCLQSLDVLSNLLHDPDQHNKKTAIQCFTSAYPLLFKHACSATTSSTWDKVNAAKNTALNLWTTSSVGVRVAATKLVQRIIQTQTRGNADPRMQSRAEPNLAMCSSSHPFLNSQSLEDEAKRLLEECIKTLYISTIPDLVSSVVNTFTTLVKARPALANSIFTSLVNWEPNNLVSTSPLQVKSVEKTFRIALAHLLRSGQSSQFTPQITEFLHKQNTRMLQAADEAKRKRDDEASRKRSRITDELNSATSAASSANKRRKIDPATQSSTSQTFTIPGASTGSTDDANFLATFDVTSLPVALVTELIIANLQIVTESTLANAIGQIRRHLTTDQAASGVIPPKPIALDPMADQGDDELQFEVEEEEEEATMPLESFELPPPEPLSEATCNALLSTTMARVRMTGIGAALGTSTLPGLACSWVTLLCRVATKGLKSANASANLIRQALFEFIVLDPLLNYPTAVVWLNEEWAFSKSDSTMPIEDAPYTIWLEQIVEAMIKAPNRSAEPKTAIPAFLLDVPSVPVKLFQRFAELCSDPQQLPIGFAVLREIASWRPSLRQKSADAVFGLCTHTTRVTRNAAIITAKRWIGDIDSLGEQTTAFALHLLSRLEQPSKAASEPDTAEKDAMVVEEIPPMAAVEDAQVTGDLPEPRTETQVTQHIELLLSLCAKTPDLLDNLFEAYANMSTEVQKHIRKLITMLIKSMGAKHPKLLSLVSHPPTGSDTLVLRVVEILAVKGPAAAPLVNLIKSLAAAGTADARFLVAILPEMAKMDFVKMMPKLAKLLIGSEEDKILGKSIFEAILPVSVQKPGALRARTSEVLSPVDLLVLLHHIDHDLTAGMKPAIEAVSLCLSMTDLYRPEVLIAFMQQVMDETVLPPLYLRTVIQIVGLHRSLQPYVATTLLNRMIAKKVWTNTALWEGFMRCGIATMPLSADVLIELPKEPLQRLVNKHPSLLEPLKQNVVKKYNNKPRMTTLLEILDGGAAGSDAV